jgi:hypothetical protein
MRVYGCLKDPYGLVIGFRKRAGETRLGLHHDGVGGRVNFVCDDVRPPSSASCGLEGICSRGYVAPCRIMCVKLTVVGTRSVGALKFHLLKPEF